MTHELDGMALRIPEGADVALRLEARHAARGEGPSRRFDVVDLEGAVVEPVFRGDEAGAQLDRLTLVDADDERRPWIRRGGGETARPRKSR
jgi:hypothetical protein